MRKFLSLVLALVMVMSLTVVSAGATDFTDKDDITYAEAIDVISTIGIIDGYADGSVNPDGQLTRQAAAKIICNLVLGPTTAKALIADTAPFPDVPIESEFAGYIAYCAQRGIIGGYGDGTFKPGNSLTGNAFMKMLLGALGYDANIEGYVGPNWTINVAKRALMIGLDEDLVDEFDGSKTVTRQEACLYALNTLTSDLVEYGDKISVTGADGTTVNIQDQTARSRTWPSSSSRRTNMINDSIIQFGEEYFNRLVRTDAKRDDFERPATTWTWKGVEVGTYADTPDLVYNADVKITNIYNDLGLSGTSEDASVYFDGLEVIGPDANGNTNLDIKRSDDEKVGKKIQSENAFYLDGDDMIRFDPSYGVSDDDTINPVGDGSIVEVYRNDDTDHIDIVVISVWGGKIADVREATSKKDAYVVVETGTTVPYGFNSGDHDEFETEDFAEDDVVAFTYSQKENKIESMYAMDSVEGSLSLKTVTKNLKLDDTTYKYAKQYSFETGMGANTSAAEAALTNKSDYVVYLDSNGLALWIEEASFGTTSYALIERISSEAGSGSVSGTWDTTDPNGYVAVGVGGTSIWDGNRAKLVFADGTVKTVNLDKSYAEQDPSNTGKWRMKEGFRTNQIVRFKVDADGDYKLTALSNNYEATTSADFTISHKSMSGTGISAAADSQTIFVVKGHDQDDYSVYTGIKNAPTVNSSTNGAWGYVYQKSGVAKLVYVLGGDVSNDSKNVTFLAGESVSKIVKEADTAEYYVYNAVVKGEVTTVMVKSDITLTSKGIASVAAGDKGNIILNTVSYDSDDIITKGSFTSNDVNVAAVRGVRRISNDEIRVGTYNGATGRVLSVSSSALVFLVDKDGNIEASTISGVKTNSTSWAYYTIEDGEITNLFVIATE